MTRKAMGLSQLELGEAVGYSRFTVIEWESGRLAPDSNTLGKIAAVLGTTTSYLLGESDFPGLNTHEPQTKEPAAPRSETAEMFAKLMKKLAVENPDLIIHFRDLEKNLNNLAPEDIQGIADGIALITGKANKEVEKRLRKVEPGEL